jgi:hypothetical protein
MEAVRLMIEGLNAHKEELVAAGISADFIQKMDQQRVAAEQAEARQERLKAEKILSTESLMAEMRKLMRFYKRARNIVKNDLPRGGWLEFGIAAKR